jgi:hypothetical protein
MAISAARPGFTDLSPVPVVLNLGRHSVRAGRNSKRFCFQFHGSGCATWFRAARLEIFER